MAALLDHGCDVGVSRGLDREKAWLAPLVGAIQIDPLTAFSLFIHDLCSDAHQEISCVRYEEEDAHIWVTLPPTLFEEERESFVNCMAEKSLDILLAEDLLILAGVEEP